MRIARLKYCCIPCPVNGGQISLRLQAWHVEMFPMTYTIQECLEDWCDTVGWRYISHWGRMSLGRREYYIAIVEIPEWDSVTQTIVRYVRGRRNED